MSYVYIQSERRLWTTGFYDPDGVFQPESDHESPDSAANRVSWLNGEPRQDVLAELDRLKELAGVLERLINSISNEPSLAQKIAWAADAQAHTR